MNKAASVESGRKRRRSLFLFQLLLVIGFLALVWFSFGQNVLAPRRPSALPGRLGDMELVRKVEGAEALAQIGRLHGTDIQLLTANVLEYAHTSPYHKSRVTVWVGRAESEEVAAEFTRKMAQGIERGGSSFSNLRPLNVAGQEVFQVQGPGGEHFFYHSGETRESIVWLTIEGVEALPFLEQAVKTF